MAETLTMEELIADLSDLGQDLSQPQDWLSAIGDEIVEDMKRNVPVDTGALKGSIRWVFEGQSSIAFLMKDYGMYQNYGVKGTAGGYNPATYHKPFFNDFGSIQQPEFGTGYKHRAFGLPARKFYDETDIGNEIGQTFISEIIEDF